MPEKGSRLIVIAGPLPPPVHGLAYITQEMARLLGEMYPTRVVDLSPHRKRGGFIYHFRKLTLTLKGAGALACGAGRAGRVLYLACEGGLGLVYTNILAAVGRGLGYPLFIHHHSYAYIERRRPLMSLLLALAGPNVTHIFLCPTMAEAFQARYRRALRTVALSNAAFVPVADFKPRALAQGQALTVGLLSNLDDSKGLADFLALMRASAAQGLNVNGVLAGPVRGEDEAARIDKACAELGGRLSYRGAVYGVDKEAFFREIDVFVFPTRYANEAQPTVIFEAQSYGIPSLSFDRGCIKAQVGPFGAVLDRDGDFIAFAMAWLKKTLTNRAAFDQLRLDAQKAFMEQREKARKTAITVVEE